MESMNTEKFADMFGFRTEQRKCSQNCCGAMGGIALRDINKM